MGRNARVTRPVRAKEMAAYRRRAIPPRPEGRGFPRMLMNNPFIEGVDVY